MYLERLDLHGFKSFAKKTTILFETRPHAKPGITAIVGPNGSGKSNIADSIRWVLGEQSAKAVRGRKTEDIIFSGSEKKARLGMAEVTITLNNEDRRAPLEANAIAITRRAFRDGTSEYRVNAAPVRLQDIQLLLAKAHFGQRTYSVIGQGMIDAVLLASPKERKEFFDEAAGVKHYQLKREETVRKLTAAKDNLREVDLVLQEITPRLRSLTRQVRRLERREEIEKELRALQTQYYGALLADLEEKRAALGASLGKIKKERDEKEGAMKEVQEKLLALEKEETQSEAFLALQREYESLVEKRAALRENEFALKHELIKLEGRARTPGTLPLAELSRFVEESAREQETLVTELLNATTMDDVTRLKPRLTALRDRLQKFLERLSGGGKGVEKEREGIEKKLATLATAMHECTDALLRIQKNLEEVGKNDKEKRNAFFLLQRTFQERQTAVSAVVDRENTLRIDSARLEQRLEDLKREIQHEMGTIVPPAAKVQETPEALLPEIQRQKKLLEQIGGIDPEAVGEYQKSKERHDFLTTQLADLTTTIRSLEGAIQELDETIKHQFDAAFATINEEFQKFFTILFDGGKAKLVLVKDTPPEALPTEADADEGNEEDVLETTKKPKMLKPIVVGIDIYATPPGKRLQSIAMLSGGERALTSIALISSFIAYSPSPFVVLDEVDAALDEANSDRFGHILDELSKRTQFITITHNRVTMQRAVVLYGVTMGDDGISTVLSVKFSP